MRGWVLIAMMLAVCGCQHRAPRKRHVMPATFRVTAVATPGDPTPHAIFLVQLDVYQMDVPLGAVSDNAAFWNRLSRPDIDAEQADLLERNGFRIGEGRVGNWTYFKNIFEKNPVRTHATSRVAYEEQHEPIVTRADQPSGNLFYYDRTGALVGKSFDAADDELLLSFWPTPRHNGQVHIQLIPAVKATAGQLQHQWANGTESVATMRPEFFYDLKLEADLDVDHFLVVGPSAAARSSSSLGQAFMVNNLEGSPTETLLIFVARPIGAPALLDEHK